MCLYVHVYTWRQILLFYQRPRDSYFVYRDVLINKRYKNVFKKMLAVRTFNFSTPAYYRSNNNQSKVKTSGFSFCRNIHLVSSSSFTKRKEPNQQPHWKRTVYLNIYEPKFKTFRIVFPYVDFINSVGLFLFIT